MCAHGMVQGDEPGLGEVRKTTRLITNSKSIADAVGVRCPGGHRHIVLVDGRAKAAAIYPDGLCEPICRGYREHRAGHKDHCEDVARELSGRPLTTHEADINDGVLMRPMGENLVVIDLIELLELAREEAFTSLQQQMTKL